MKSKRNSPGINSPVIVGRSGLKVVAWRNLDNPRARPNFHVSIDIRNQAVFELIGLTPGRIKELGEQLLAIHAQITADACLSAEVEVEVEFEPEPEPER